MNLAVSRRTQRIVLGSLSPFFLVGVLFALGVVWPLPAADPVVTDHPLVFLNVTLINVEQGVSVPRPHSRR